MFMLEVIFLMTILFMFMKHPLSMGIIIILQTILIAAMTGSLIKSFWFSYMLIMILLSGALVMFIYMASIASNEKFYSSISLSGMTIMFLVISIIVNWVMDPSIINMINNENMSNFLEINQEITLMKMFNWQNMKLTLLLILYLLFTMIVVTFNVNIFEGPMRAKN